MSQEDESSGAARENVMRRIVAQVGAKAMQAQQQDAIQQLLQIEKQEYESASKYSQVILGLGYAGFFTLWAGTRDQMSKFEVVATALLMGFSLLVYIAFEVYQMIFRSRMVLSLSKAIRDSPLNLAQAMSNFQNEEKKASGKLRVAWYAALALTIIPALMAAGIMFSAFVVRLGQIWVQK